MCACVSMGMARAVHNFHNEVNISVVYHGCVGVRARTCLKAAPWSWPNLAGILDLTLECVDQWLGKEVRHGKQTEREGERADSNIPVHCVRWDVLSDAGLEWTRHNACGYCPVRNRLLLLAGCCLLFGCTLAQVMPESEWIEGPTVVGWVYII